MGAVISIGRLTKAKERVKVKINKIGDTKMANVNVKPLADRVLVKPAEAEQIIPDTAKEKPMTGEVVAVGCGKKDEPMTVKVGDKILYGKYSGTEINIEGEDYLIMRENDIYAII